MNGLFCIALIAGTMASIGLILGLIYYIIKDTDFYRNGFIKNSSKVGFFFIFFFACQHQASEEPQVALFNWHYGLKDFNLSRFQKVIFGERKEQIKLALAIYQPLHDYNITWVRDSFQGRDTVFVFYKSIDTEWGDILFCKRFVKVHNQWKTRLLDR